MVPITNLPSRDLAVTDNSQFPGLQQIAIAYSLQLIPEVPLQVVDRFVLGVATPEPSKLFLKIPKSYQIAAVARAGRGPGLPETSGCLREEPLVHLQPERLALLARRPAITASRLRGRRHRRLGPEYLDLPAQRLHFVD